MRKIVLSLFVAGFMGVSMQPAQALTDCKWIPSMCPVQNDPGQGDKNGVPEPGTLGLLAMGAAASIGMLWRKKR